MATRGIADQAMPDQGVVNVRWHHRHYGWRRGYQCVLQGFPKFPESIQRGLLTIAPHRSSVCVIRDRKSSVESASRPETVLPCRVLENATAINGQDVATLGDSWPRPASFFLRKLVTDRSPIQASDN